MRCVPLLISLGLTAFSVARVTSVRDRSPNNAAHHLEARAEQNLPAIKAALQVAQKDAQAIESAIKGLTAANIDTQSDVINKALLQLSSDTTASAAKIKTSGAVGIMEASGLMSSKTQGEWGTLLKTIFDSANNSYTLLTAKQEMIKTGGKVDKVIPGIKAQKQSLLDILAIVPSQVPSSIKSMINSALKGSTSAVSGEPMDLDNLSKPATLEKYGKIIDDFLDQIIATLKGTATSFTLPAGIDVAGTAATPAAAPVGGAPTAPKAAPTSSTAAPKAAPTSSSAAPKAVPTSASAAPMAAAPKAVPSSAPKAMPGPKPKGGKGPAQGMDVPDMRM